MSTDVITESELLRAIQASDRYFVKDRYMLSPDTSALAEIWGAMIFERVAVFPISRLTSNQLAAIQASRQMEL